MGRHSGRLLADIDLPLSQKLFAAAHVLMLNGDLDALPFLAENEQPINVFQFRERIRRENTFWLWFESFFPESNKPEFSEEWNSFLKTECVFRVATFFSTDSQNLAAIVGTNLKNIWDNPVTAYAVKIAKQQWGSSVDLVNREVFFEKRPADGREPFEETTTLVGIKRGAGE